MIRRKGKRNKREWEENMALKMNGRKRKEK